MRLTVRTSTETDDLQRDWDWWEWCLYVPQNNCTSDRVRHYFDKVERRV